MLRILHTSQDKQIQRYCTENSIDPTSVIIFPSECQWASNRFPALFTLDGKQWNSTEQYMQYKKCDYANIPEADRRTWQQQILACSTAEEAVQITRNKTFNTCQSINDLLGDTWHTEHKYSVLLAANQAKFTQNPELQAKLLATGDKHFLGIGGHCTRWAAININGKHGENWAGKIVMQTREWLQAQQVAEPQSHSMLL